MLLYNHCIKLCFISVLIVFLCPIPGRAGSLRIPPVEVYSGQVAEIPVDLEQIDNMAGIKFALKYDTKWLTYQHATKTKQTEAFMHAVNQKKPGVLIIVMASAKGIAAADATILNLYFQTSPEVPEKIETRVDIVDIQLLSDKLKAFECQLGIDPLTIWPVGTPDGESTGSAAGRKKSDEKVEIHNNN